MTNPPAGAVPMYGLVLGGEEPSIVADVVSIVNDLTFASEAFWRASSETDDALLCGALWQAGAISYRRAFTRGKGLGDPGRTRTRVPDQLIQDLSLELQEVHARILEEANQHIAHRAHDDLEQMRIILLLSNPSVSRSVEGVVPFFVRYVAPSADVLQQASESATSLRDAMTEEQRTLLRKIIEASKEQDINLLYSGAQPLQ